MLQKQRRTGVKPIQSNAVRLAVKDLSPKETRDRGLGGKTKLDCSRIRIDGGTVNLEVAIQVFSDGTHVSVVWPEIDCQSPAACGGG
jgi:glycerol kinase